ncbi:MULTISPECIES: tripartite tricarboxylate transporter substrate binding protein [unclassified Variovorax]|uniref:Bug family tripartite tricarboxylate transporter substrate binding protein n=1 Tax=unclassified Variovorax TaxID=663243 RepID=UPI001BD2331A|nr:MULTISPECIES: tripartite tricarboxylate transporter substrate binding protein [unclassified Variovorax]
MPLNFHLRRLAMTLAVLATGAASAAYPDKPVRLIVAFSPGGATDVVARALGVRLGQLWGHPVVVENKTGAGGNIGADFVAKSPSNGYTLLLASPAEIAINPYLYAQLPYDPAKDLLPVSKVASAPLVLVVNAKAPSKNVKELVANIKATPAGLNYASSGTGGPQHLAGELFRLMSDTKLTHVPYKGGAPAITDLLGGQVDLFFSGLPPALPQVKAGRLRALAVTTDKPSALLPGIPTVADSGYPGFNIENWQGLFVPAGTPPAVVQAIAHGVASVAADKSFAEQLTVQGAVPDLLPPAEFAAFVRAESQKYSKLVKESGAKAD